MGKHLQILGRSDEVGNRWCDPKLLANPTEAKAVLVEMEPSERRKALAMMSVFMPLSRVSEMTGYSLRTIGKSRRVCADLIRATCVAHTNIILARACDSKAGQLLASLDVTKVADDKKAKSIRDLAESAIIFDDKAKPKEREEHRDTMELIFRVKQRMMQKDELAQ